MKDPMSNIHMECPPPKMQTCYEEYGRGGDTNHDQWASLGLGDDQKCGRKGVNDDELP